MAKYAVISDAHIGQTGDDGMGQYSLLSRAKTRPSAVAKAFPGGILPVFDDDWERRKMTDFAMDKIGDILKEAPADRSGDRHTPLAESRENLEEWLDRLEGEFDPTQETHIAVGHTHRADRNELHATRIVTYNLGSWLVEPTKPDPETMLMLINTAEKKGSVTWERVG